MRPEGAPGRGSRFWAMTAVDCGLKPRMRRVRSGTRGEKERVLDARWTAAASGGEVMM